MLFDPKSGGLSSKINLNNLGFKNEQKRLLRNFRS
jgi:hypothetical protein